MRDDVSVSSKTAKGDEDDQQSSMHPRKRNLRQKTELPEPPVVTTLPPVTYEKPPNPYETYLAIRRQVIRKKTVIMLLSWEQKTSGVSENKFSDASNGKKCT